MSIWKKQIENGKEIELNSFIDAQHDALTDLPNRECFNSRLELALANKEAPSENHLQSVLWLRQI